MRHTNSNLVRRSVRRASISAPAEYSSRRRVNVRFSPEVWLSELMISGFHPARHVDCHGFFIEISSLVER
jgi:hypothetical protein